MAQFQGNARGPVFGPNQMLVTQEKDGETYQLNIFPDYFNEQLRAAGRPMYFYYQPDAPRLAQFEDGSYKFNFIKFEGVLNANDNIDVPNTDTEVAGGILSFTTTLKIPDDVITAAIQQLKNNCMNDAKYVNDSKWMLKNGMPDPVLGVVPIIANVCSVSNIGQGEAKPASGDDPWMCLVEGTNVDSSVKDDKGNVISNASTNPTGENAFTLMLGQYPASIIEQAFKGASLPIYVQHRLQHMFYMDDFHADIHADANMSYTYVSSELKANFIWVQADVQASFSDLQKQGALTYSVEMNTIGLTPDQQKLYQAQTDKVFDKIQDWFLKTMIDQTPAKPDPAKAANNNGCVGVSLALKVEHDIIKTDFDFHETISETYLPYNFIAADICGLLGKMGDTPDSMKKYFQIVHLDESFTKIHVVATANAFWPTPKTPGDPINQISLQVSYPDSTGTLTAHSPSFVMANASAQPTTTKLEAIWDATNKDSVYIFDFSRLDTDADPGIDRNTFTIQKIVTYDSDPQVELTEPLQVTETTTDKTVVVTASPVGTLRIDPILLDTDIPSQVEVSVTFSKENRESEVRLFNAANPTVLPYLAFTADGHSNIPWSYQVNMTVKGSFPNPSLNWTGPKIDMVGSGPLVVSVPAPPDDLAAKVQQYLNTQSAAVSATTHS